MRPKVNLNLILNCCIFCIATIVLTQNVWCDDKKLTDKAELSFVQASGNTDISTFNGKNTLKYDFSKNFSTQWKASALYGETDNEKTAEKYATELRGDHNFYKNFYYYLVTGWTQDEFAGIDDRYYAGPGAGYKVTFKDRHTLAMELGANYAREVYIEDPESETPYEEDSEFLEGRGFGSYIYKFNDKVEFSEEVEYLKNFKEESAYTVRSTSAIKSRLNSWLELKVSYEVNYNNRPKPESENLKYTDTLLSVALVVNI